MRAADRTRLPVPLERIPTVYPLRNARKGKPASGRFRGFLKRMREALRTRSPLESDYAPCREHDEFFHLMVNPATGLLMNCGVDAAGNPYGVDLRKPLESLASEAFKKLGVNAQPGRAAREYLSGSTQISAQISFDTGSRRICRKLRVGGREVRYENNLR